MLTERELDGVESIRGVWSIGHLAMFYRFYLDRPVSRDEVSDAVTRLAERYYRAHPEEKAARDRALEELETLVQSTAPWWRAKL